MKTLIPASALALALALTGAAAARVQWVAYRIPASARDSSPR